MDSITIFALCRELDHALEGARLDKIHQPSDREVVFTVRSRSANFRLLLSANRAQPRAHFLFAARPVNPEEPPMFCMLLRKRLEGGRIVQVRQLGNDRIVTILTENINDLGDTVRYVVVLEVMGKHSNLMLCDATKDGNPGRIIDSIVHVSPDLSRVRPVLPGFQYTPVPPQAKRTIESLKPEHLEPLNLASLEPPAQAKALAREVAGIGPMTAREVVARAFERMTGLGSRSLESAVVESLMRLDEDVRSRRESPSVQYDELGRPIAAAPFLLTHCERYRPVESLNHGLDALFQATVEIRQTSRIASELTRSVTDTIDKLRGKLTKVSRQLDESVFHEDLRIKGELLTTYSANVPRGQSEVTLPNYYDEEKPWTISVDPALSPIENAQRYFKQSSKRKRSIPILTREREETLSDIAYLEAVLVHLQDATAEHLQAIREELIRQGFFRQRQGQGGKPSGRRGDKRSRSGHDANTLPPDAYVSCDGFTIRVGRNNLQNDRLTLKSSQPHDVWLHVKDQPGSHVVIQTDRKAVPESTLHEAAILAAYFSKGRDSANVSVDYSNIRNVWKPNGARPGHVLYDGQKTLYVTPERTLVHAILKRKV